MESGKASETYARSEIRRILGINENRLRSWERAGLTEARQEYDFSDLISLRTLQNLREQQIPAKRIQEALEHLSRRLSNVSRPLDELKIVSNGGRITVELPGERMEAITGQLVFHFESENLRPVATLELRQGKGESAGAGKGEEYWFHHALDLEQKGAPPGEVVQAYREVLASNPLAAGAWVNIGTLYHREGMLDHAESNYREAVEAYPEYALAHFNLGNVCEETGRLDEAIEHYETALSHQADFADAHYNLASVYERRGHFLSAAKHWRQFLCLDATSPWANVARRKLERLPDADASEKDRAHTFRKPLQDARE